MEYRTLEIDLQSARDLNKVNLFTKMDIYVDVSISGGEKNGKQKTRTPVDHNGDSNPTWNFPIKFTVDEDLLQMNRLTLDFKLICERALGDKDVGEVHVPVKELLDSADGKKFVSYQVRKPSGKPKGQLSFLYHFGEKILSAAPAPPYGSAMAVAPPQGKVSNEPVIAYPSGSSSVYPPSDPYPPPTGYPAAEGGGGHYPPPAAYPGKDGHGHYPPPGTYPAAEGSGYHQAPPAGYVYPPPPPPGYGYPPQPGYGYPPQQGYGYLPPPPVQKPPKKNKFGLGLGAGLLGGALGGLLVGDMISDGADFDF